jgi:predicted N-acetyltransferase YhbS
MTVCKFSIVPQEPQHQEAIEDVLDEVFGLSRRIKTSYRLREGEKPVEGLSFVAVETGNRIVGAISFWNLFIGENGFPALLLGPLAVAPDRQGIGIGRALMKVGLERAAHMGARLVILVGDEPYYGRVGFRKVTDNRLILPGPVDPDRLLFLELHEGALEKAKGLVLSPRRYKEKSLTAFAEPGEACQA